jgi:putative ABC transport system permease protein
MNVIQLLGSLELGLIYGLVALGVYLSFRTLDFPDLTVDGSFPLGAAVAACLILKGYNPWLATAWGMLAGALAGAITAYLHVGFKILGLLAGILTMTGLYSVNLRVMDSPNLALLNQHTLFDNLPVLGLLGIIVGVLVMVLVGFLHTHLGLGLRACGINAKVSRACGVKVDRMVVLGLALSNGIVALAGALFAQSQGFADIAMGAGTVVTGLASVILGEALVPTRKVYWAVPACVLGSIAYRSALGLALNSTDIGLRASDLNIITAVLVILTMVVPKMKKPWHKKGARATGTVS